MNGAEFNMLLLVATGVVALIGKYVYERVMTRIEERQDREAAQTAKQQELAPRS
jgi:uncharacterized membrane protein